MGKLICAFCHYGHQAVGNFHLKDGLIDLNEIELANYYLGVEISKVRISKLALHRDHVNEQH